MGKEQITVAVIGNVGSGRTHVTAAISKYISEKYGYTEAKSVREIEEAGNVVFVECETDNRRYILVDCEGHYDAMKGLINGTINADGVIAVVSADEGPMSQTREQLLYAYSVGTRFASVFLNKCDVVNDVELLYLEEEEMRDVLFGSGFDAESSEIVQGSALKALEAHPDDIWTEAISVIVKALESIPVRMPLEKGPLLMGAVDVLSLTGRGTMVTGKIERGCVKVGDEIEVVGLGKEKKTGTVSGISRLREILDTAGPGDDVGILIKDLQRADIERGQVIAKPGSIEEYDRFRGLLYLYGKSEGGRSVPFHTGIKVTFYTRDTYFDGFVHLPAGEEMIMPGSCTQFDGELLSPIALTEGTRFYLTEGGRRVAVGAVSLLEEAFSDYDKDDVYEVVDHYDDVDEDEDEDVYDDIDDESYDDIDDDDDNDIDDESYDDLDDDDNDDIGDESYDDPDDDDDDEVDDESPKTDDEIEFLLRKWRSEEETGKHGQGEPEMEEKSPAAGNVIDRAEIEGMVKKGRELFEKEKFRKAARILRPAAEAGDPEAQRSLGDCFNIIRSPIYDEDEALIWYKKAAAKGNARAMAEIGFYYSYELRPREIKEKNITTAIKWFRKAAELGDDVGAWALAGYYDEGNAVEKSPEKALFWYEKAAERGHRYAILEVAKRYRDGIGTAKDPKRVFYWYSFDQEGCTDPYRMCGLADCYYYGIGTKPDMEKAQCLYEKALKAADLLTKSRIAREYEEKGTQGDLERAFYYYSHAVTDADGSDDEDSISEAMADLGNCYYFGIGTKKDRRKAAQLFEKAEAKMNDTHKWLYATLLEKSKSKYALEKAFLWNLKAAEEDQQSAQLSVAKSYHYGLGTGKNIIKAKYWYRKAAKYYGEARDALQELRWKWGK